MRANPAADPRPGPSGEHPPSPARRALDRFSSFRVTYVAIVVFLLLYVVSVRGMESYLQAHFEKVAAAAIRPGSPTDSVVDRIKSQLDRGVIRSAWVRLGEVRVYTSVVARDTRTFLYLDGHTPVLRIPRDSETWVRENARLLPATATVRVSVPHNTLLANAILVLYAGLLFIGLFAYNRRVVALENQVIDEALEQRDVAARRAERIEHELESVRTRVLALEPEEQASREEIAKLHGQRKLLEDQLAALARQELELRGKAELVTRLEEEGRALEQLLEEASSDLQAKDSEIQDLERSLKRAIKSAGVPSGRAKEAETLARRMRTLYPNLEIDDRAIEDIVALRDETTKLRVEECLKRLSEDAENVGLRRKVGGLPNHLSVYEIGFAGKRRIYYTKGKSRRFRVLVIGAKNTQDTDLVYMSKIPKSDVAV